MIVLMVLSVPAVAHAQWTPRFPGVEYLERTDPGPRRIFATKVNLCEAGIRVRATRPDERNRTVSSFGQLVGAAVSVNGNMWHTAPGFCDPETLGGNLCGVAAGDGVDWEAFNTPHWGYVGFGKNVVTYPPDTDDAPLPGWVNEAVAGHPRVVNGGVNIGAQTGTRAPRTAIGFTEDERTMLMVVVDGRSQSSIGADFDELGAIMVSLGAHNALAIDGGGSSTMWTADAGVMNRPSDGSQRTVRNHLSVIASGFGPPEHCNARAPRLPESAVIRHIPDLEAFAAWKFTIPDIHEYIDLYFAPYAEAVAGNWPTEPPTLFQVEGEATVWVEDHGTKRGITSPTSLSSWRFDWGAIEKRTAESVAAMQTGPTLETYPFLIKGPGPEVYVLDKKPALAAEIVAVEFPQSLVVGESATATVTVKNIGSRVWPANAITLAATEPRGHASAFCADWADCAIAAVNDVEVPLGEVASFTFEVKSDVLGEVTDCFNLKEIQWFSDIAQGGPTDDTICVTANVSCVDCDVEPTNNNQSQNNNTGPTNGGDDGAGPDAPTHEGQNPNDSGCSVSPAVPQTTSLWVLVFAFVGMPLLRRR